MDFVDRELQCVECLATFTFSASEQQFFRDKGFENDPKRCKVCKAQHKKGIRKAVETRQVFGVWYRHNGALQACSESAGTLQNLFPQSDDFRSRTCEHRLMRCGQERKAAE